ncbi:3-hydroxyacyl-CoA dehydrogenase [Paraburkholderia pallida]|uniref:3-hydroxyacyl-CoA dehydrogenase n=2 Tax=Paraburkholderia pallida TaxID=2547399 RepID=A0A4P7D9R1_9BURK|nr:3-hydroxyacyl-CoA dehydrogenase [Paraburkholderia pallida]
MGSVTPTIAILGAGSIGVSLCIVFARAGCQVRMWDVDGAALSRAQRELDAKLAQLARANTLSELPGTLLARVTWHESLEDAVKGAALVQECIPEQLELKQRLLADLAVLAPADAVLASSTSAITPSALAEGSAVAGRILVGHPANPPWLLPVIEVVPSVHTNPACTQRACAIYRQGGLTPVMVRQEVEGFVFNRLQGAVLREAYCLVRDGVISVADLDAIVTLGLGRRWGVVGPFETADLNTRGGIASHAKKMGAAYARMGAERGQHDPWTDELVEEVSRQRREILEIGDWEARVQWRDEQLLKQAGRS